MGLYKSKEVLRENAVDEGAEREGCHNALPYMKRLEAAVFEANPGGPPWLVGRVTGKEGLRVQVKRCSPEEGDRSWY